MKWSVICLFGRVMNNNVELCSDWLIHCAAHFSSSHSRKEALGKYIFQYFISFFLFFFYIYIFLNIFNKCWGCGLWAWLGAWSDFPYFLSLVDHMPVCLCGKWNLMYCNRLQLAANHVPLVAHVILLERVICFPCLSEYRHPASLHFTSPAQPGT